jgi:uncharacterized small protein (DUF1192 family)
MLLEARTVERMKPKSQDEKIAELEALIERMKADLAKAREALESAGDTPLPKSGNGI